MRKISILISCSILVLLLSGCRLAVENKGPNEYKDKFIGYFITTEYLDLLDENESNINDGINKQIKDIPGRESLDNDEGFLYAHPSKEKIINEQTGEIEEYKKFVFPGVDGVLYCYADFPYDENDENYGVNICDSEISDVKVSVHDTDESTSTTMEGTIYVAPTKSRILFNLNPVYQSYDGKIYATKGTGMAMEDASNLEGSFMNSTKEDKITITRDGKSIINIFKISLSVNITPAPEKIVVLQMDENSNPIFRQEFKPGKVPSAIRPESKTQYFVVETHNKKRGNTSINKKITRELYGKSDDVFYTFSVNEQDICLKNSTTIEW